MVNGPAGWFHEVAVIGERGDSRPMDENHWERYGAAAGVTFAVLVLVATAIVGILGAIPGTVLAFSAHEEAINSNAGIVRVLWDMNIVMFSLLFLTAGLFAVAGGLAMVRKELVGPWLG